ncbi:bile acid:sodium symporter family protein [Falsibacillus albus]|uniref:Bile acid:sodium symporter family protein n=1 Tax=Falsibacillus albus TaxID=2478915 RepID=A0A3L7K0N1_9BACI|nr:bile acid:sodium symporter family protein [Falsibacillus albus]RLQ96330.1 bile acid:sodium symporter family protein [Falsibacillus albus]
MLISINAFLQKIMPFITPLGVIMGIVFSKDLYTFVFWVPWIFAFMTLAGSLNSSFQDLKRVFFHPLPMFVCLGILHIVMPLLAFAAGEIFFHHDLYTRIGLILSFLIPTGITSLVWVFIYSGNSILTLSIILLDTLLSPFMVPLVLFLFVGTAVEMNSADIMKGLFFLIVIPSVFGMLINQFSKGKIPEKVSPFFSPFSKIAIGVVVAINSSAIAPYLKSLSASLLSIGIVVFILAMSSYFIGFLAAKILKADAPSSVSLTYNSGMRNISAGAVLAITYFPIQVSVPVVAGMLFQQILAAFTGGMLHKFYLSSNNQDKENLSYEKTLTK